MCLFLKVNMPQDFGKMTVKPNRWLCSGFELDVGKRDSKPKYFNIYGYEAHILSL